MDWPKKEHPVLTTRTGSVTTSFINAVSWTFTEKQMLDAKFFKEQNPELPDEEAEWLAEHQRLLQRQYQAQGEEFYELQAKAWAWEDRLRCLGILTPRVNSFFSGY
jgi:hypothetical protein